MPLVRPVSKNHTLPDILLKIGVHAGCVDILSNKAEICLFYLEKIKAATALVIKQDLLSLGSDAAVHHSVICHGEQNTDALLIIRKNHLPAFLKKLSSQPFSEIKALGGQLDSLINTEIKPFYVKNTEFTPENGPYIMGILNTTPDSFSDGGQFFNPVDAEKHAQKMIDDGAHIIDVGGESSRPGAKPLSADEECSRVIPVIEAIRKISDIPVSVDTCKPEVTHAALEAGADMINDIRALSAPGMAETALKHNVPVCIMHMQGTPETMQNNPEYSDAVTTIYDYLQKRILSLISLGIPREKILVDPGIGFGKTLEHNCAIIRRIDEFAALKCHILLGTSRKSMIGAITGREVTDRLAGSLATVAAAYPHCLFYRVHDVKETLDSIKVLKAIHP